MTADAEPTPGPVPEPLDAGRLRLLLAATRQQVFRAGADWSSLCALSRDGAAWEPGEPVAAWLGRHVAPEDHARLLDRVREAARRGGEVDLEVRTAPASDGAGDGVGDGTGDGMGDGAEGATGGVSGRAQLRAVPVPDGDGRPQEWWAVLRDVSADRAAGERQILAERQRRIRNTLALVRSIVRRSAAHGGAGAQAYAQHLEGRIDSLIRVQVALARSGEAGDGTGGKAGLDLETLLRDELAAAGAPEDALAIAGPPLLLPPPVAEGLALAFHELSANSIKFGALAGVGQGRIEVAWSVEAAPDGGGAPVLRLRWEERSGRAAAGRKRPSRRGFGTELLERTLAYGLGAATTLEHGPEGLSYGVAIPLRRPGREP